MVLIKTTLSVVLAVIFIAKIEAYKKGPPVYEHPDICGSMSPKEGHDVEPLFRPVPFALTTLSASGDCYRQDKPLTGQFDFNSILHTSDTVHGTLTFLFTFLLA